MEGATFEGAETFGRMCGDLINMGGPGTNVVRAFEGEGGALLNVCVSYHAIGRGEKDQAARGLSFQRKVRDSGNWRPESHDERRQSQRRGRGGPGLAAQWRQVSHHARTGRVGGRRHVQARPQEGPAQAGPRGSRRRALAGPHLGTVPIPHRPDARGACGPQKSVGGGGAQIARSGEGELVPDRCGAGVADERPRLPTSQGPSAATGARMSTAAARTATARPNSSTNSST